MIPHQHCNKIQRGLIVQYFSIQFYRHMESYAPFFTASCQSQPLSHLFPVNILVSSTFETNNMKIGFDKKGEMWLVTPDRKQFAIANSSLKVQPTFNTQLAPKVVVKDITIHHEGVKLVIRAEDKEQLAEIYQCLRLRYAHTGFGDYFRPIKKLGKGAFAAVYLVEHKITKERLAAKVFSKQGQNLEFKGKEALQNEIKTLRHLQHPNIIRFEGVFETESLIYLITEYLSGGTLEEMMRDRCKMTGAFIEKVLKDTLEALCYLQTQKVMHRDLKPENILLRESDQRWVLADFGLSAFEEESCIYEVCGTMGYMAPEILISRPSGDDKTKHHYNAACDVYSLGAIAYNLLVGVLPFKVETDSNEKKILGDGLSRPEFKELDKQIKKFILSLMEKEPSKRLSPYHALKDKFFINKSVKESWYAYSQRKIDERYEKILKIANVN